MVMKHLTNVNNPYEEEKIHDACGLFGMMDCSGRLFDAEEPVKAMVNMHDRGNGLGGGFAVYGIYPDFKEDYAFHVMYLKPEAKERAEEVLADNFNIRQCEELPVDASAKVLHPPIIWRYFVSPRAERLQGQASDDFVVTNVMKINTEMGGAYVFSSGRNMGVFKGVGFPEDIAAYFRLREYRGYLWVCHSRFPTNTPGWWGGAHPFNILDWTVVHNGELSSYGTNRRYLEMYGYNCTMQTDTEVLAYALDLLRRRQNLPINIVGKILAPPLWDEIAEMESKERSLNVALRQCYGGLLMNGPFSIIAAHQGEMLGLTDRIKLRPLTAAIEGDKLFLSSEEAAIRCVSKELDKVWSPLGGEPVVGRLKDTPKQEIAALVSR
jgi:glutamate synthase domain-containing protein 1